MADTHVQALLDDARDDPEMCRGVTRKRFHDARRELVKAMGADITMGDVKLDIVDFVKGVATFANTNAWSQAIREAYAAHPCVDSHTASTAATSRVQTCGCPWGYAGTLRRKKSAAATATM